MSKAFAVLSLLLILSFNVLSHAVIPKKNTGLWLTGTWEGTGYQIDDNSTWTMRLTVHSGKLSIAYPSLNCGGEWKPIRISTRRAIFTERLSYGNDKCTDNGQVVIERLSDKQLVFLYRNPGEKQVTSSAVLNRKTEGDPLMSHAKQKFFKPEPGGY